jgi:hypothetical protein
VRWKHLNKQICFDELFKPQVQLNKDLTYNCTSVLNQELNNI